MKLGKILNYLVCPSCQGQKLNLASPQKIICSQCQRNFEVIKGVPVLIDSGQLGEQEKNQQQWFEDHYSHFSDKKYVLENWRQSVLKRALETDFALQVKTYLDVGCGATGYTTIEGAKKGWLSFGIDISLEAMVRAKTLAKKQGVEEKTAFLVCSAEKLPFKSNLFDYVSALSVLEHLANDLAVIKSIGRITKKGGYSYLCVPNTYRRIWPFLWPVYFYFDQKIGHQRHYAIEDLVEKMAKRGFRLEKVVYNGHLIKFLQLGLEKLKLLNDKIWWQLEKRDLNSGSWGVQLNAYFKKAR